MIDGLIQGRLHGVPAQRTGASGRSFVTAKVRTPTTNGDAVFVNVICFSEAAQAALLALGDGDAVALAGELTPKVWQSKEGGEPRPALDMVAHSVLSAYHVQRKRQAMAASGPSRRTSDEAHRAGAGQWRDFDG